MKLKQVFNYQLYDARTAVTIFYGVILSINIFFTSVLTVHGGEVEFGGMESSTVVFLFIAGLNSFKGPFRFFLANGVSRKTQFWGFILSVPALAGIMALADSLIALLLSRVASYESMYAQLYGSWYAAGPGALFWLEKLVWSVLLSSAAMMVGFCITLLYYRMSKLAVVMVSVFVPVFFVVVLPYIDYRLAGGRISSAIFSFLQRVTGFASTPNPYIFMLFCVVASALAGLGSWMLMRRAVIKE